LSHLPPEVEEVPIDRDRLSALFSEHEQRLRRFVVGILRDRAAAEDIVQIVFSKAAEEGEDVRPEALKSWLYRVAMNEAVSWRRRWSAGRRAVENVAEQATPREEKPEAALVREETIRRVRLAMERLSPAQRQVVQERVYENRKFVEIAADMQAPLPTVITHMRRALEKLRQHLKRSE
jgi:RNA polymerase sigma-70 factor, ECF subfamily